MEKRHKLKKGHVKENCHTMQSDLNGNNKIKHKTIHFFGYVYSHNNLVVHHNLQVQKERNVMQFTVERVLSQSYNIIWVLWVFYLIDPAIESRDSGEDGRLLLKVAAKARHKAGNAVDLPNTLSILTVQRAAWVTLDREEEGLCFEQRCKTSFGKSKIAKGVIVFLSWQITSGFIWTK